MSTDAVIMMVVAMTILWGGLIFAIISLNKHELPPVDEIRRDL